MTHIVSISSVSVLVCCSEALVTLSPLGVKGNDTFCVISAVCVDCSHVIAMVTHRLWMW